MINLSKLLGFELNEETYQYLKNLPGPLGVISVAGMYRSGKSYLLNRMILNRSRGFDVGHTINACTKVSSCNKNPRRDNAIGDKKVLRNN